MRLDELANSSFLGGEERKEDKSNFRIPFNVDIQSATRRARGNLFLGKAKAQPSGIRYCRNPKKGPNPLTASKPNPQDQKPQIEFACNFNQTTSTKKLDLSILAPRSPD